jgi:diaminopropionate ammonia-lyase
MARLGLSRDAVVLIINTEGDTDVTHYREVVWEGKHPACD